MNSKDYLDILDDNLRPSMDFYFPNGEGIFQDDNACIHRARNVLDWFEMNSETFQHMNWPAQSPDLNPIENLWDELERKLRDTSPLPKTLPDLGDKLQQLWSKLDPEKMKHLVESMPRQMEAIIRANGGPIDY